MISGTAATLPAGLDAKSAAAVLLELHGIAGQASDLVGELDRNFLISIEGAPRYVLKIYHAGADGDVLDFQNRALRHVLARDAELPVPRPIADAKGREISTIVLAAGSPRHVRLLEYLPGRLMGDLRPYSPRLLRSLGVYLARLDRALAGFEHPAMDRQHMWALTSAPRHRELLVHIKNPEARALVAAALDRFDAKVVPLLTGLRRQVVHHDANEWNVLVDAAGDCAGVFDFGDMAANPLVAEVAVACAYAMMAQPDPVKAMLQLVAGYHDGNPLTDTEIALVPDLVRARLAQSLCMSSWQHSREPANDYLLISQADALELLRKLSSLNDRFVGYALRDACGLPANPATPRILNWLASEAEIGPVCSYDLTKEPLLVFDWTAGSADLEELEALPDMAAKTDRMLARLRAAGAVVGVGRYREPRTVYRTEMFETPDPEERRTVHLGIDLFMAAGEPVLAPLAGRVHLVANNAAEGDYGPVVILEHRTAGGDVFYTLYGHLGLKTLTHRKIGEEVKRGETVGWVGEPPTNGNWVPHLHFQLITDLLDRGVDIEGVVRRSETDVWESISPNPNVILGMPVATEARLSHDDAYLLTQRRLHLGRSLSISYAEPLKIVRGRGQFLIAGTGDSYLDMVNNVAHVGHCHPRVVAAGQAQMAELNTNTRYLHDNIVAYARSLTATLPPPLSVCFFVNSGSEANDLARRLARAATGATDTLVVDVAYHGNLSSLIDISPYKYDGPGGKGRPPGTWVCEMPDGFRGRLKYGEPDLGRRYAGDVGRQLEALQAEGRRPAAFFCESILSCGGQIVLPDGFLAAAYDQVRAAGGLCVADEVQVGFGRVGSHMWAFETQGVVPDIVTMGKPIGNGHPLAAVVTTPAIANAFASGMEYFNTFGGNPVSCAIGLAVLEVVRDERLQANARRVGARMLAGLGELQAKHRLIGDVRGLGLFLGFELVRDRATLEPAAIETKQLVEAMKARRILLSIDGPLYNVIKIKPPLVFDVADCDRFLTALDEALREIA